MFHFTSSAFLPLTRMTLISLSAALAMSRTRRLQLLLYLLSEILGTIALESALLLHWPYVPIYLVVQPIKFMAMYGVVRPNITASLTALMLAWVTYLSLPADISLYSATAIIQGGLFILFGISAVKKESILALLWIFVGIFNLAFSHGWNVTSYARLNEYWNAVLCVVAFSCLSLIPAHPENCHSVRT